MQLQKVHSLGHPVAYESWQHHVYWRLQKFHVQSLVINAVLQGVIHHHLI